MCRSRPARKWDPTRKVPDMALSPDSDLLSCGAELLEVPIPEKSAAYLPLPAGLCSAGPRRLLLCQVSRAQHNQGPEPWDGTWRTGSHDKPVFLVGVPRENMHGWTWRAAVGVGRSDCPPHSVAPSTHCLSQTTPWPSQKQLTHMCTVAEPGPFLPVPRAKVCVLLVSQ